MNGLIRCHMMIYGAVQGIGFRPFLYRLAHEMKLTGWVSNLPQGVIAEVEGETSAVERFVQTIDTEKPALASIQSCEVTMLEPAGYVDFQIRDSSAQGSKQTVILPDIATCPDCFRELNDPADRRYHYPFINCTNCGPRFSIMESLPYDRANTSMKNFTMCPDCQKEYLDPMNRRFHAQPNACPVCGPSVHLVTITGSNLSQKEEAIRETVRAIKDGKIVAVKGIGGFHLMADPFSVECVQRLRDRKHREEKPFALMMPDIETARRYCLLSMQEETALRGTAAPIMLVHRLEGQEQRRELSALIAPNNPLLGIMLPYTPLHHLLMQKLQQPVIATSGNIADEPICIDDHVAGERLGGIADLMLVHDRPIVRHADDSILRIIGGREVVFRRGRGLAPLPILLDTVPKHSYLAVGAHLKNTIAMNVGASVFVSQHIGDLETEQALDTFKTAINDIRNMYEITPEIVVADSHPEYLSTKYAQAQTVPLVQIQHHAAHVFSCMAENHLRDDLLGVSWDGTGFGDDGTIWGGEFFSWSSGKMNRCGTFKTFPLPGGSAAIKEPRRVALGMLHELSVGDLAQFSDVPALSQFTAHELETLCRMIGNNINTPRTSSVGRIFDAVSSLMGLRHVIAYEGQAALELESLTVNGNERSIYPFFLRPGLNNEQIQQIDWTAMILGIIQDVRNHCSLPFIAQKFHNTLSEIIVTMAKTTQHRSVVLSGGCFQNAYLTERTIDRLKEEGFSPYWHQRIPPNDGGISLGQLYGAILLENGNI